jgi:hypothetical protein
LSREAEAINEQLQQDEDEAPVQDEDEALVEDEIAIQDEVLVMKKRYNLHSNNIRQSLTKDPTTMVIHYLPSICRPWK